ILPVRYGPAADLICTSTGKWGRLWVLGNSGFGRWARGNEGDEGRWRPPCVQGIYALTYLSVRNDLSPARSGLHIWKIGIYPSFAFPIGRYPFQDPAPGPLSPLRYMGTLDPYPDRGRAGRFL